MPRFLYTTKVQDTTDCTGVNTGSLQTAGGAYIAKSARVDGVATFSNTTVSTSTTNGSVVVKGGLGLAGALYAGGTINPPASTTAAASVHIPAGTAPTANALGDLWVSGTNLYFNNGSSAVNLCSSGSGLTNPMTTLGDLIMGDTNGVPIRLAAPTSGELFHLVSGAVAQAPSWVNFNTDVLNQHLTYYADWDETSYLGDTDTVLIGFAKLQTQIKNTNPLMGAPTGCLAYSDHGTVTLLQANSSKTKKYLQQTGLGMGSAAPLWQDFNGDVQATPLVGLSVSDASPITVNDSVLSGIGKAQAQINGLLGQALALRMNLALL